MSLKQYFSIYQNSNTSSSKKTEETFPKFDKSKRDKQILDSFRGIHKEEIKALQIEKNTAEELEENSLPKINQIEKKQEEQKTVTPKAIYQWLALLLGVLAQPFYATYKAVGASFNSTDVYQNKWFILFGIIVSVVAFPAVYRKTFDSERPNFIQMIPIFTAGLGWQTIVDTVKETINKPEAIENSGALLLTISNLFT